MKKVIIGVFLLLLLFLLLVFMTLRSHSREQVFEDFLSENPSVEIIDIAVGEGDGSTIYYHIQYKEGADATVREAVYLYLYDKKNDRWEIINKEYK